MGDMDTGRKEDLKLADRQAHEKAVAKGEMTFTLRSQDQSSPRTIAFWILENIETAPEHKLRQAMAIAIAMREHVTRRPAD